MNAEEFYERMKDALTYLGVHWGDKADVQVWIEDGKVHMAYCDNEASFPVPMRRSPGDGLE